MVTPMSPRPQAVAELGWAVPTAIQARAIPLAMEGRDLLCRARTGSGKTGAYGLPVLHKLLGVKEVLGDWGHCGGLGTLGALGTLGLPVLHKLLGINEVPGDTGGTGGTGDTGGIGSTGDTGGALGALGTLTTLGALGTLGGIGSTGGHWGQQGLGGAGEAGHGGHCGDTAGLERRRFGCDGGVPRVSPACPQVSPAVPQAVRALVLVPSAELARQVGHTLRRLTAFCGRQLRVAELCGHSDLADQRSVSPETPAVSPETPPVSP